MKRRTRGRLVWLGVVVLGGGCEPTTADDSSDAAPRAPYQGPINPSFDAVSTPSNPGDTGAALWDGKCAARSTGSAPMPTDGSAFLVISATTDTSRPNSCPDAYAAQSGVDLSASRTMTFDWRGTVILGPGATEQGYAELTVSHGANVLFTRRIDTPSTSAAPQEIPLATETLAIPEGLGPARLLLRVVVKPSVSRPDAGAGQGQPTAVDTTVARIEIDHIVVR